MSHHHYHASREVQARALKVEFHPHCHRLIVIAQVILGPSHYEPPHEQLVFVQQAQHLHEVHTYEKKLRSPIARSARTN